VPLSENLGTLTSWKPLGLSRPVTGLIYLLPSLRMYKTVTPKKDRRLLVSLMRRRLGTSYF